MGHDWILLVRKVVYDPNNITPALCLKKPAFPLELTTLRFCIHVLPSAQPYTTRWKIAAHLKTQFLVFCCVAVHFIKTNR